MICIIFLKVMYSWEKSGDGTEQSGQIGIMYYLQFLKKNFLLLISKLSGKIQRVFF